MRVARSMAVAISTLLCAAFAAGCDTSSDTAPVMLASGTTEGVVWYLWGWESAGSLCMATGTAAGPVGGSITLAPQAMGGGQCGFDNKQPDSSYFGGAEAGGSPTEQPTAALTFGPLPTRAARIKVAADLILTTRPLPSGKGLPAGRFWVWAGPFDPPASEGAVLDTPQPLDDENHPVAFQNF